MSITLSYPQVIQFHDGTQIELNDETWRKRHLVVETDRPESEVRRIFRSEQFSNAGLVEEIIKDGQIGAGMIRKSGIWQMHVRLFSHDNHIQIDAEAELSNDYGIEHLTHGWISAFKGTWDIILKHFGQLWVYHKKARKYVSKVIKEGMLKLEEPKTKTDVALIVLVALGSILVGLAVVSMMRK